MIKVSEDLKPLSELQAATSTLELQRALAAGERAVAEGRVLKHEDVVAKWERRLPGE